MSPVRSSVAAPRGRLARLAAEAADCRACELWEHATQTVFGAGRVGARLVMVGEQPGDVEDREGVPFVGPAGRLLAKGMAEAGIDPGEVYLTNAVKHFRFHLQEGGKRRIHQTPDLSHMVACRPWLEAELAVVEAPVLVVLGAVAARVLLGSSFRVTKSRGTPLPWSEVAHKSWAPVPTSVEQVVATVHPSSVLRADDREAAYAGFVADLVAAAATAGLR